MIQITDSVQLEVGLDVAAEARRRGGRQIMRLLQSVTMQPFVAGTRLLDRLEPDFRHEVALFTVSGWEPGIPEDACPHDGTAEGRLEQATYYLQSVNPLRWLAGMPNAVLCQMAMATDVRGPNLHWVGDGATLLEALAFADDLLAEGAAPTAALVVYDPPIEQRYLPPGEGVADAVALLAQPVACDGLTVFDPSAVRGRRALDVALEIIAAAGTQAAVAGTAWGTR